MRKTFVLAILFTGRAVALAQNEKPKPAYDFFISREEKIKLAESAAPAEISGKSTVYILEHSGYIKAREGNNGFTCFVDRQTPWNSEPTCFDAEGSATILPTRFFAEEERAKGKSEDEIKLRSKTGTRRADSRRPASLESYICCPTAHPFL